MADEAQTTPMLETILKEMREGFSAVNSRIDAVEKRLERIEIRLDKIESIALEARAVAHETQLDLSEFREQLNLPV